MSLSDCIRCWDTPCSCGWREAEMNASDYRAKAEDYLLRAKAVENHTLARAEPFYSDTSPVYCKVCGLVATYKTWNREFFNRECKTDE